MRAGWLSLGFDVYRRKDGKGAVQAGNGLWFWVTDKSSGYESTLEQAMTWCERVEPMTPSPRGFAVDDAGNDRTISAQKAARLLAAATPGPWTQDLAREPDAVHLDAPNGDARIDLDSWEGLVAVYGREDEPKAGMRVARGNADLICAAHDLAASVVVLHAEVERLRALLKVTP